uniref:GLOBIN domain-containing protein n=1 Tax=Steinernema glaseri TaxID=37863 RepID=A0A1I8ADY0_9BILA
MPTCCAIFIIWSALCPFQTDSLDSSRTTETERTPTRIKPIYCKMGNEHSGPEVAARLHVERHSLDAGMLRQVRSAHGTPRSAPAIEMDGDRVDRNFSFNQPSDQMRINTTPCRRRMSVDDVQRRNHTRFAKLSLTPGEEMMCSHQQRRYSRASGTYDASEYGMIPLSEQLKLSTYQILLLQQTWGKLKSSVFSNTFRLLTQKNVHAKEMFQKMSIVEGFSSNKCCDMKEHTRLLNDLIETAILEINSPCKVIQGKCMQIGQAHYPSTAKGAMNPRPCGQFWEDLADCLTESVSKAECLRGKREPMKAWIALISYVIDNMKCGYMSEFKRRSVSRASSGYITSENP